ncbi:MAG: ATP-binding cassette domain-containing protein [Treponema sp.]|jgi:peptide/nickel transport system ATP-binding protein|nr:ATP-binding cassette domain-containing protein [Treponema sp.]
MTETILRVDHITKVFHAKKTHIRALTDVSFNVGKGETIGIVGESGCGKTTLGRCIVRAVEASDGNVFYTGKDGVELDFLKAGRKEMKSIRKDIQMIFQDPYSSLDPRMTVLDIISEPLRANYPEMSRGEVEQRVIDAAGKTGLNTTYLKRYPHAFSGGQRQRIGIARALILNPAVIVCDEAVSALDVSIQAQVINLLKNLQREMDLTYIFISHDLSVVEYISDRVGVMYLGKLVEYAGTQELYSRPLHPYTEALLSAVPIADPDAEVRRLPLAGEIPNPANPPGGCYFHPRCAYADKRCGQTAPEFRDAGKGHFIACHRSAELNLRGISYEAK